MLRVLSEQEGFQGNFHNKRVLVIHSGGDSKTSATGALLCGKLFSPVSERTYQMRKPSSYLMNF